MQKEQKTVLIYIAVIIVLCFAIYSNSLNNAFVSDDIEAILENPHISQISHYWKIPANLLNSLSYLISGFNPFAYHLINIILHAINTILVFFFLRLFFKAKASLLAACLFATHPVHAEAVTWISGKPYLIITLFVLITYLLYHYATYSITISKRSKITRYILSLSVFSYFIVYNYRLFSLMPLFLVLSDITFNRWRRNWRLWIPFFAITILRIILAKGMILERISYVANMTGQEIIWTNPLIKMTVVLFSHLGLLLWPLKLTFCHGPVHFSPPILKLGITSLFFLILSLPFIFRKTKEIFFGICLFVLFFVPVYSPVAVASLISERYLYFPSISLSIFVAFLYERYVKKSEKTRRIITALFILIIAFYSLRTIIRNEDWKTQERFWQATMAISYNNPSANNEMGLIYNRRGNIKRAIDYFKKAIELDPYHSKAYNDLGGVYYNIDKKEEAAALFKKAIEINPRLAEAYNNLGNIYYDIDKKQEATTYYQKAIEINPRLAEAYNNLAIVYYHSQQYDLAIKHCDRAIELGYKVNPEFLKTLEPYRSK